MQQPTDDPEKLKAALEQLEAERERRIGEKLEKGTAIRRQLGLVIGVDDPKHVAPARDEQGREIVYDVYKIVTGVPRHGRDEVPREWYERQPPPTPDSRERPYKDTKPIPPLPKPEPKVEAPPDPQRAMRESW